VAAAAAAAAALCLAACLRSAQLLRRPTTPCR
jgi:hypothetical protein